MADAAPDYDVIIIGGGIHGVGVAQAAAAAGYRALVLEKTALGCGTSSRSSKLIHGGLRYLETLEFKLVRESLAERERLIKLAPSLVKRQRFHIPVYRGTSRRPWTLHAGLSLYALLAGFKKSVRYQTLNKKDWQTLDGLNTNGLQQVFSYSDAQTNDQQLTRAVMTSAQSLGAQLNCPAEFVGARITQHGCEVFYRQNGESHTVSSATLVNAAGPWATTVDKMIDPAPPEFAVENIQGTHIELAGEVSQGCYYLEAPQDQRAVFVMPWQGHTLVGTTEHPYSGDPAEVRALDEEIEYLLTVFRHYFPDRPTDILNAWAGLRVLPRAAGAAFKRSRETQLPVDDAHSPRLVSIYGGKLTAYRVTAQKVINKLRSTLGSAQSKADTADLPLTLDD